jgi:hypothetical protein
VLVGEELQRGLGHCNAVSITDANKLLVKDSVESFREANRQGAFVFWNHPHWIAQRPDGIVTLTPLHLPGLAVKTVLLLFESIHIMILVLIVKNQRLEDLILI